MGGNKEIMPKRLSGLLAIISCLIALLITIPFAASFYRAYGSSEPGLLRPWLYSMVRTFPNLFDIASPTQVYQVYGRIYSLVIPLSLPALVVLKKQMGIHTRLSLWSWRIFWSGALLGALGIIGDYWPDPDSIWVGVGFILELIGILALWVGGILYGITAFRERHVPRWIGGAMIGIAPAGILGLWLLFHIPSGPLLGYVIFSILIGVPLGNQSKLLGI